MNKTPPTEEEIQAAVAILKKLSPGLLPFEIFHEIARLTVLPIVEVVPLRMRNGNVEVLLLRREANDPVWPNALHTPGTVLRSTDELGSFKSAFERIYQEIHGAKTSQPVFVESSFDHLGRGTEVSFIHWVECLEDVPEGTFYPADNLPHDLVEGQRGFIARAVQAFKAAKA